MNKKRIITLVLAAVIVVIIATVVIIAIKNNKENNEGFTETQFEIGEYKIDLKSKKIGRSESGYKFVSYYDKKYEFENYDLDFGIRVFLNAKNENIYDSYSDYDGLNEVGIFNKRFKYKQENKKIKLLYKYDNNFYIEIDLKDASNFFNKDGSLVKNTEIVDEYNFFEKTTQDSEFRNFISFNISKK